MQIKNLAWGFLLENDIEDFRQDLESVIALVKQKGWRIYSYQEKRELLEEFEVVEYAAEHNGFTYVFHQEYIIFYKDELAYNQKIFVIMHEIGHIEAHHTYSGCILGQADTSWKTNEQEQEADIFACECLAPSCILSSMGADTVEKLKRMSLLPDRYNSQQPADCRDPPHRRGGEKQKGKRTMPKIPGLHQILQKRQAERTGCPDRPLTLSLHCGDHRHDSPARRFQDILERTGAGRAGRLAADGVCHKERNEIPSGKLRVFEKYRFSDHCGASSCQWIFPLQYLQSAGRTGLKAKKRRLPLQPFFGVMSLDESGKQKKHSGFRGSHFSPGAPLAFQNSVR